MVHYSSPKILLLSILFFQKKKGSTTKDGPAKTYARKTMCRIFYGFKMVSKQKHLLILCPTIPKVIFYLISIMMQLTNTHNLSFLIS